MIGIISAMHEEIQTILENLQNITTTTKGKRIYFKGLLFDKSVVLVFSRWGKVASATTTTQLINDFNVDEIIFTGVAGSIQDHINIGDIIIGHKLYQYDMDASPLIPPFEIPILERDNFETDAFKRDILLLSCQKFLKDFDDLISIKDVKQFHIEQPKVLVEDIASGDQFISTEKQLHPIKKYLPSVACVEMEGAAVAQVCFEYEIPFSIIRTISDKANDNSHIEFQKFAKIIASNYALEIIKNYFELLES